VLALFMTCNLHTKKQKRLQTEYSSDERTTESHHQCAAAMQAVATLTAQPTACACLKAMT
jgi:hypothetical protein